MKLGTTCGGCCHTDGMCYTSLPPKVKCTITNEFHLGSDECDVEVEVIQNGTENSNSD